MGDPDEGRPGLVGEAADLRQDLGLDRHVERGRRLVRDDDGRAVQQRDRDRDALAHAAGELVRIGVEALLRARDADPVEGRPGAASRAALRDTGSCARTAAIICVPIVSTGLSVIMGSWNTIAICAPAHPAQRLAPQARDVLPVEQHRAAGDLARRIDEAEDGIAGDALAGSGFADEAEDASPAPTAKVTPSTAFTMPACVRKMRAQVPDLENGLAHRFAPRIETGRGPGRRPG